ncbi:hypothetical protein [Streptomyces acidiscabies]|uniref:Uncharacterized protein n=1 Tax=Streptomyces acidiscabies TaxID=42234 RepID=A0AAP6BK77_9ACTN|nr:hypothetical protein [Streptomyces acidiscabies]MBP5936788.1 hypothetical protein [Streptomyces sp. LBUM 1476]MBZ3915209.1 hypothetical protein [Streptomyces acidiscabies]MDX2966100.1 hypothetical protein [Streptomyces acidiscabies]MDX3021271.1 hypothetical protein [Streptomyces acidiscabies]MDX3793476.1 hypothetical protein [Streptomyces acidiscabies]
MASRPTAKESDVLILIELRRSPEGHLEGTVKTGPEDRGHPFHGVVSLVSALEAHLDDPQASRFSGGPDAEPGGDP